MVWSNIGQTKTLTLTAMVSDFQELVVRIWQMMKKKRCNVYCLLVIFVESVAIVQPERTAHTSIDPILILIQQAIIRI